MICYCFGYTREDLAQDLGPRGESPIAERIAAAKRAGGCDCAVKNPKGR